MRFPNGAGHFPETEDVWPTEETYDKKSYKKANRRYSNRKKKGAYARGEEDY